MQNPWGRGVWSALGELGDRLAIILPGLLIMLTLVALGTVLGWLAWTVIGRLAHALGLDSAMERWGAAGAIRRAGVLRTPSDVIGLVCFWGIFVLFASLGIDSLGLERTPGATALLVAFLPPLLAAVLILLVGWLLANFLSQGLLIAAVNAGVRQARLLARGAYWAVLLFAAATALTHLGIGKEMVVVTFAITFGGMVFALALAFGLGGRGAARDFIERKLRREGPPERERLTHL